MSLTQWSKSRLRPFQPTKDAYDYLMTAPSVKVWDEGKRQYGSNGSAGGGPGFPQPDATRNSKPKPNAMRREVGMVGWYKIHEAIGSL